MKNGMCEFNLGKRLEKVQSLEHFIENVKGGGVKEKKKPYMLWI